MSKLKSLILVSTNTGLRFNNKTTSITESQEKLGIIISSPFFLKEINDNIKASVPDPTDKF